MRFLQKPKLAFLLISLGILMTYSSCNSTSSDLNENRQEETEKSFEKIKASNEFTQNEMEESISGLFANNYTLQTKSRKVLEKKYLSNENFAEELAKKALIFLREENDKFDQYNAVFLLSKSGDNSIRKGREVIRKYIMSVERKEYVGPKMNKYISKIKSKL